MVCSRSAVGMLACVSSMWGGRVLAIAPSVWGGELWHLFYDALARSAAVLVVQQNHAALSV
eukprot:6307713-Ditylum_brightwellii.AAC.1